MKITSTYSREWPKLGFSILAGEEKELPENKDAQEAILATDGVSKVGGKPAAKVEEKKD